MNIHPSAVVDPSAQIGAEVTIGPFCSIGPGVAIGDRCNLMAHVHIEGPTSIGRNNIFHPTVTIGPPPQDFDPAAPDGRVEIGNNNVFREGVTVHAPKKEGGATRIGNRNHFYFTSHVGHDSEVGDDVILDSGFVLGGHSAVESGAHCGPHGGTHQFATVGKKARVLSHIPVTTDAPPFMIVDGNHYRVAGVHRAAVATLSVERLNALERAYETLWNSALPRGDAFAYLKENPTPEIKELISALQKTQNGKFGRAREALR